MPPAGGSVYSIREMSWKVLVEWTLTSYMFKVISLCKIY